MPGSFGSERFNQTARNGDGESSFLSDSALRSAGFQEKRDFPFSLTLVFFFPFIFFFLFLFFLLSRPPPPPPLKPSFCYPSSFVSSSSVGVVEGHPAHRLSFRDGRRAKQEESERRSGRPQYSVWSSLSARTGSEGHRLSGNAEGVNTESSSTAGLH